MVLEDLEEEALAAAAPEEAGKISLKFRVQNKSKNRSLCKKERFLLLPLIIKYECVIVQNPKKWFVRDWGQQMQWLPEFPSHLL